jgi:A/G-specific adenine glycosylase
VTVGRSTNTSFPNGFFVRFFARHGRAFPWRSPSVLPFHLLVAELLLRQTRAEGVPPVWLELRSNYPSAAALADARPNELFTQVARLGFGKQRVDALLGASAHLEAHHAGEVPVDAHDLLAIPHIGLYSARALRVFAFGARESIVDTNVLRLLSRYHDVQLGADVRRTSLAWELADHALPSRRAKAREHNYGILDFTGAICKARPQCAQCPLRDRCAYGRELDRISTEV